MGNTLTGRRPEISGQTAGLEVVILVLGCRLQGPDSEMVVVSNLGVAEEEISRSPSNYKQVRSQYFWTRQEEIDTLSTAIMFRSIHHYLLIMT